MSRFWQSGLGYEQEPGLVKDSLDKTLHRVGLEPALPHPDSGAAPLLKLHRTGGPPSPLIQLRHQQKVRKELEGPDLDGPRIFRNSCVARDLLLLCPCSYRRLKPLPHSRWVSLCRRLDPSIVTLGRETPSRHQLLKESVESDMQTSRQVAHCLQHDEEMHLGSQPIAS